MESLFKGLEPAIKMISNWTESSRKLALKTFLNTDWKERDIICLIEGERIKDQSSALEIIRSKDLEHFKRLPCSVKIVNVQQYIPEIKQTCLHLFNRLDRPVTCNAYITPGSNKNALPFHIDPQESAIFQLHGRKAWEFSYQKGAPLSLKVWDKARALESEKRKLISAQGEWLSIPYCVPHRALGQGDELSIHLTFATIVHFKDTFRAFLLSKGISCPPDWADSGLEIFTPENLDQWCSEVVTESELRQRLKKEFLAKVQRDSLSIMKYGRNYSELPFKVIR